MNLNKKIRDVTKKLCAFLSYLIFTKRCPLCDEIIDMSNHVCNLCEAQADNLRTKTIECSGYNDNKYYDGAYAAFYYDGVLKTAIGDFKFKGVKNKAKYFSMEIIRLIKAVTPDMKYDFVAYVPMGEKQYKIRKYNHSKLIAELVADEIGIPCFGIITKIKENKVQHQLNAYERADNVKGVYDVIESLDLNEKTILLIDDIFTTGSTLNECCKVLKINNSIKIYCFVIAKTRFLLKS